ncbi:hypothetical protein KFE25_013182 [Diacronema lutheri]|uniref:Uncharacterized protein n=1 Tax=Diacronema lutheri TaxID=2081491 RepID=A0A8J5XGK3_DIALT|nr:hypothetical protein KFE25_013182 [Diacronema lutheri]
MDACGALGAVRAAAALDAARRQREALRLELVLFTYLCVMAVGQHLHAHGGRLDRLELPCALLSLALCARRLLVQYLWRSAVRRAAEEARDAIVAPTPAVHLLRSCGIARELFVSVALVINGVYVATRFAAPAPARRCALLALPAIVWLGAARAAGPSYARSIGTGGAAAADPRGAAAAVAAASAGARRPAQIAAEVAREAAACAFGACVFPALAAAHLDELVEPRLAACACAHAACSSLLLLVAQAAIVTLPELFCSTHGVGAWACLGAAARRPRAGWALLHGLDAPGEPSPARIGRGGKAGGAAGAGAGDAPIGGSFRSAGGVRGGRTFAPAGGTADGAAAAAADAAAVDRPPLPWTQQQRQLSPPCVTAAAMDGGRGGWCGNGSGTGCAAGAHGSAGGADGAAAAAGAPPAGSCGAAGGTVGGGGAHERAAPAGGGCAVGGGGAVGDGSPSASQPLCTRRPPPLPLSTPRAPPAWSGALCYPRGYVVTHSGADWLALGHRTRGAPGSTAAALTFLLLCAPDRLPRLLVYAQVALCLGALVPCALGAAGARGARALVWPATTLECVAASAVLAQLARARRVTLRTFERAAVAVPPDGAGGQGGLKGGGGGRGGAERPAIVPPLPSGNGRADGAGGAGREGCSKGADASAGARCADDGGGLRARAQRGVQAAAD